MQIRTKRIHDDPDPGDGTRILVDRLWPRGVSKSAAQIAYWARSVAPTDELRKWYRHDPGKWEAFRERYFSELENNSAAVEDLRRHMAGDVVTFVFGSRETELNNATALRQFLESRVDGSE